MIDIAEIECLRIVAMATSFGTEIATMQLVMKGGLGGRLTECRYCRYLALKRRCHGNHFLAFDGL